MDSTGVLPPDLARRDAVPRPSSPGALYRDTPQAYPRRLQASQIATRSSRTPCKWLETKGRLPLRSLHPRRTSSLPVSVAGCSATHSRGPKVRLRYHRARLSALPFALPYPRGAFAFAFQLSRISGSDDEPEIRCAIFARCRHTSHESQLVVRGPQNALHFGVEGRNSHSTFNEGNSQKTNDQAHARAERPSAWLRALPDVIFRVVPAAPPELFPAEFAHSSGSSRNRTSPIRSYPYALSHGCHGLLANCDATLEPRPPEG